jgi:hypothetical protein
MVRYLISVFNLVLILIFVCCLDSSSSVADSGEAYIYLWSGSYLKYQQTLQPPTAVANGQFGKSVSVADGWAFVGAPFAGGE